MADNTQNPSELRDTPLPKEESLRLSEARFRALAESASDAIVTIDTKSKIVFVNKAAENIFGFSVDEMLGQEITMLMPDYLRHVHKSAIARYTETGRKHINWTRVQLPGLHKDGHEIPVELSIAEHMENGEKRFTGILRDVSERVEAERALKRQTSVIQLLQDVAIASNQANTIREAIATALAQVCHHSGAALGHAYFLQDGAPVTLSPSSLWYAAEPENFAVFRAITEATVLRLGEGLPGRVAENNAPVWIKNVEQDANFPRKRESVDLKVKGAFAFPVSVKGEITAVLEFFFEEEAERDEHLLQAMPSIGAQLGRVIERTRSEESVRHLSVRLLRAQDAERRRIGRELHDSAGQYLAALQMNLDTLLEDKEQTSPAGRLKLSESLALVHQCSAEIRTLSYLLHPPLLEDAGLVPTVNWFVEGFVKRSGIQVTVEMQSDIGRLNSSIELALFRIIQECLTNTHRHSNSKTAAIGIDLADGTLVLKIKDQGVGIPPGKLSRMAKGSGVGIAGMGERLSDLGGTLQITSDSNGTVVTASIPIKVK
jgi:PAS domain S-box-containing protein